MTVRTATLEADVAIVPDAVNVAPRPVVAIVPSDADPLWDEMRVSVDFAGTLISRAFDPGADIVTGAPIAMVTTSGAVLVTMTGEALVTGVLM